MRKLVLFALAVIIFPTLSSGQSLGGVSGIGGSGGNGGAMASSGGITLVNSVAAEDPASATTIASPPINVSSGNLLVVAAQDSGQFISGISDTAGNVFAIGASCSSSAFTVVEIYYAKNTTSNASDVVTVTFNSATTGRAVAVLQYAGANTSSPFETCARNNTVGTLVSTTSFSPATAGNANVVISGANNNAGVWTSGTGYSLEINSGTKVNMQVEDLKPALSGSQVASINYSISSGLDIVVASFKK